MNQFRNLLNLSIVALGAITAYRCVGFDDRQVSADDTPVQGISFSPAEEGDPLSLIAIGTVYLPADGIVTKGDRVTSAANGGVRVATADDANAFAVATTSAADGGLVEILIR